MSYVSLAFFIFIAVTYAVYYLIPKKYQWCVLLAASYVFFLFSGVKYCVFIVVTTLTTYAGAWWIEKLQQNCKVVVKQNKDIWDKEQKKSYKATEKKKTRHIMAAVLLLNFGILFFLKYYNFTAENINRLLSFTAFKAPILKLILPLGISFYTFQSMGYIIDVYREDYAAEKNIGKFALFVSFFPTIIQGPISKFDQLAHQLYEPHKIDWLNFKYGIELILWGYFKKLVIADRIVSYVTAMMEQQGDLNGTALLIAVAVYSVQLYADFSAGIDISRGVARLFGIDLAQNFRQPYFATSLSDFWTRWHISLGAWMKTYVFYPLALSGTSGKVTKNIKKSKFGKTEYGQYFAAALPGAFATLVVFLLVGIWHGAEWKYVLFGLYNGAIMMTSTLLKPFFEKLSALLHINKKSFLFRVFQIIRTLVIVGISNLTDIVGSVRDFFSILKRIFITQSPISGIKQFFSVSQATYLDCALVAVCVLIVFIVSIFHENNEGVMLREVIDKKKTIVEWVALFVGILVILLFGIYGPGYDPADFVYKQF